MQPTAVAPVPFIARKGEVVCVEWSPAKPGILNGCLSGARVEPQSLDFRGGRQPAIEIDGKLHPAFLTLLVDSTWILSVPSVIVLPSTVVRVRFISHADQDDALEFIYGEDQSAKDWLRSARDRQRQATGHASV